MADYRCGGCGELILPDELMGTICACPYRKRLFKDIARPDQIDEDAAWQKRNDELFDMARRAESEIMAAALMNRWNEFEKQRLAWKINVFRNAGIIA